jgi:acyl-CoA dehydrogenase
MLGAPGSAFVIAQTRLGGGRIHHAMRTVGQLKRCFDMMCERALSRSTRDGRLADYQMVQEKIADSYIEIEQFKLLVLRTAWLIDKYNDYRKTRKDIAAIKVAMPKVYHDVAQRAMQIHGALGISNEMPFSSMMMGAQIMGIADGPTEVHKVTIAKQVLRDYKAVDGLFPSAHIPTRRAAAREQYAELLEQEVGNL